MLAFTAANLLNNHSPSRFSHVLAEHPRQVPRNGITGDWLFAHLATFCERTCQDSARKATFVLDF
jgi:hypothetical protein